MHLEPEQPGDETQIAAVHAAAFATDAGAPPEVALVSELRASTAWLPELSIVARDGREIVGHACTTRAAVGEAAVLALGPIGVLPGHQSRGVGSALMYETINRAARDRWPLIGLLGSPGYYSRFGFEPARERGVVSPIAEWGEHFQVLVLGEDPPVGEFRYPEPFLEL